MNACTTRDIALHCKLSQSTVSLALREDPRIPEATRRRVKEAAAALGYRPNPLVSTLMSSVARRARLTGKGNIIAVANVFKRPQGWLDYAVYNSFYQGAETRAADLGYRLSEIWFQQPGMTPKRIEGILKARGIEGLLILPLRHFYAGRFPLDLSELAAAAIGYTVVYPPIHLSSPDNYQGANLAFDHLAELGWKRIGFYSHAYRQRVVNNNWLAAFLSFNYNRKPNRVVPPLLTDPGNHSLLPAWMKKHRPDVIVTSETTLYKLIRTLGYSVPEDVSLVHFEAAGLEGVDWAGLDQRPQAVGAAAIDLIIGQLHRNERGIPAVPKHVLIEASWKDGATLAPPPRG